MSTRLLLSFAAKNKLKLKQFDIKTAFLYGSLDTDIYMEPPEGYSQPGTVRKLKRSLYGLKQSPRMWNEKFTQFMSDYGLKVCQYDRSIFYRLDSILIVIVYVDDGLIIALSEADIIELLAELRSKFEMREMEVSTYRGLQVMELNDGIFIHQTKFTLQILDTFNMSDSKATSNPILTLNAGYNQELNANTPYRSEVGSLAYLADTTRPDIAFAVNQCARSMANLQRLEACQTYLQVS